jgi:hypothetical protein
VAVEDSRNPFLVGFTALSRRLYAEGCETKQAAAESWALAKGCGPSDARIRRGGDHPLLSEESGGIMTSMAELRLEVLPDILAVCRFPADAALPTWALAPSPFVTISRTVEELSITATQAIVPPETQCERNYRALRVGGSLSFNLVGILAAIAEPLAGAGLSIFAISTFDTDYVLVKARDLEAAVTALEHAGHHVDR